MDKDEYWLLDSVVESWCPLRWLAAKNVGEVLNKRDHGLSRDELITLLNRLFQRGDLLARRMGKGVEKQRFTPTQTDIQEALSGRLDCSYGLTLQGGARWEDVSKPQWERYLTDWVYADPREGEIVGSDVRMVKKCVSLSVPGVSVVPGSKHWDVLKPWQATYWKVLPLGHRVRYSYYDPQERPPESKIGGWFDCEHWEWVKEVNNWYTRYHGILNKRLMNPFPKQKAVRWNRPGAPLAGN